MAREQGSGVGVQAAGGNRAILLTPPGGAAIAVVRLAGAAVAPFLAAHFDKSSAAGRCTHGTLRDGSRILDDPVAVLSTDGRVVDLNLHGGPWVVQSVLDLARRHGFEIDASAGVPSAPDAVDAVDDLEREVLQLLPAAATELALRVLLAQESAWRQLLRRRLSPVERAAILADRSLHWLLHPPRVAIVGIPNVGKSTLANRLFAQERSITANLPGTTRDWVGETANIDGLAVVLVDTPGLRETTDAIERQAIERSRDVVAGADLVVLVLDPTQPRAPGQVLLEETYPGSIRVLNKSDREGGWDEKGITIHTIGTTGEGIEGLRTAVREHFLGPAPFDASRPRCWTDRQRAVLLREEASPW